MHVELQQQLQGGSSTPAPTSLGPGTKVRKQMLRAHNGAGGTTCARSVKELEQLVLERKAGPEEEFMTDAQMMATVAATSARSSDATGADGGSEAPSS